MYPEKRELWKEWPLKKNSENQEILKEGSPKKWNPEKVYGRRKLPWDRNPQLFSAYCV